MSGPTVIAVGTAVASSANPVPTQQVGSNGTNIAIATNISASTTVPVTVPYGGSYVMEATGNWTGGGNVQVQKLMNDGVSWVNLGSAFSANGDQGVGIGGNAQLRAVVTGTVAGVTITLSPLF